MNWFLLALKNYAGFSGRARRKEYWMFALFSYIVLIAAMILDNILGFTFSSLSMPYGALYCITGLILFLPSLAVGVRRMHDINKSGWMLLVSLIPLAGGIWLLILLIKEGTQGENQYGSDPKSVEAA